MVKDHTRTISADGIQNSLVVFDKNFFFHFPYMYMVKLTLFHVAMFFNASNLFQQSW